MCTFFPKGLCTKGEACTFAHDESELREDAWTEQTDVGWPPKQAGGGASNATKHTPKMAEDEPSESISCLQGPREFESVPTELCSLWLRHPALCGDGDACIYAHGLMELGLDVRTAVKLECGSDESPVTVQVLPAPGKVASASYGKSTSVKGARPSSSPYGKGGTAGDPMVTTMTNMFETMTSMFALGDWGGSTSTWQKGSGAKGGGAKGSGKGGPKNRFADKDFRPVKLCQFWVNGPEQCTKGDACTFAHGVQELQPNEAATCDISRFLHSNFKPTQMCQFFAKDMCTKGMSCTFAHSEEELKQ